MSSSRLAGAAFAIALAGAASGVCLNATLGGWEQAPLPVAATAVAVVVAGVCGTRVVDRAPGNPVGWLILALALSLGLSLPAEVIAYAGLVGGDLPRWTALVLLPFAGGWWLLVFAELGLLVMCFPDGRTLGGARASRWRRLPMATVVALAGAFLGALLTPGPMGGEYGDLSNPFGIGVLAGLASAAVGIFMLGFLACLVLAVVAATKRYRRSEGDDLLQMKWLALVGGLVPLALAVCFVGDAWGHTDALGSVALPLVAAMVSIAVAIAIQRYKLYEIDHVISRTLAWTIITATVAAAFVASSIAVGVFAGSRSPSTTASATLVAAVVGWRLLAPVQTLVDRRFDRVPAATRAAEAATQERVVQAARLERRRLERDLHDGAQQRMVALGITVRRLQRSLPPEASALAPALDQVVDEIAEAVGDLRRLASGLRPARLDDGIEAALTELTRSSPVPVVVTVSDPRPPPTVETTAYFVACEGITNAVKHAGASRIEVDAGFDGDVYRVVVRDDGVGGARLGSGLTGLSSRVATSGGLMHLESRGDQGTVLSAEVPCGS